MQKTKKSALASLQVAGLVGLMMLALLYLVYHTIEGDRGLLVMLQQQQILEERSTELAALTSKVDGMRNKVKGLSDRSLDLDLLEEQVRKVLHYSHPHEVIVLQ